MLILDTNVLSELMRQHPNERVVSWFDRQSSLAIWTTAITVWELLTGIGCLPEGRRKMMLQVEFHRVLADDLADRIMPFDHPAASAAARLAADRQRVGRLGDIADMMIAGITQAAGATLVTRNTRHFADLSVSVVNPWDE